MSMGHGCPNFSTFVKRILDGQTDMGKPKSSPPFLKRRHKKIHVLTLNTAEFLKCTCPHSIFGTVHYWCWEYQNECPAKPGHTAWMGATGYLFWVLEVGVK